MLLNAATKPLNVLVLAVMAAAAILTTPWVLGAALPIYGLMMASTIRDPDELAKLALRAEGGAAAIGGRRSLEGITGVLREEVIAVLNEERGIGQELARAPVKPEGIADAVDALCDELIVNARRASDIDLYLASIDVRDLQERLVGFARSDSGRVADAAKAVAEQLQVVEALVAKRLAFDEEVAHLNASLGTIRARLVQARAEAAAPAVGAADVTELRDRMRALAQSLAEAYGHNDPSPNTMKGT